MTLQKSCGLYEANVHEQQLVWVGDIEHLRRYHYLEDVYEQFKEHLDTARITTHYLSDQAAWWQIEKDSQILIAAVAWEETTIYIPHAACAYDFDTCTAASVEEINFVPEHLPACGLWRLVEG